MTVPSHNLTRVLSSGLKEMLCNYVKVLKIRRTMNSTTLRKLNVAMNEAKALFEAGKYSQSITKYQEIINSNPRSVPALTKLAQSYEKVKDNDKAINTYKNILNLKPKITHVHQIKLARLLAKENDNENAIKNYKAALGQSVDQPSWVYFGLGRALMEVKKEQANLK